MFDALTYEERMTLYETIHNAYKKFRKLERYVQRFTSPSFTDQSLSNATTEMVELLTVTF